MVTSKRDQELMEKLVWKLAEFQFYTLIGFEKTEKQIKAACDNIRRHVIELKKSYKKGNHFKVPFPSLVAITEEEGENDEVKSGLPQRTDAKKEPKVSKITVQNKPGRLRKKKLSNSPINKSFKNRKLEASEVLHKTAVRADSIINHLKLNDNGSTQHDEHNEEIKLNSTQDKPSNDHNVNENENQGEIKTYEKGDIIDQKENLVGCIENALEVRLSLEKNAIDSSLPMSNYNSDLTALKIPSKAGKMITLLSKCETSETVLIQPEVPKGKGNEALPTEVKNLEQLPEVVLSPEMRCTRSKMAKPKLNADDDTVRREPLSSEDASSSEKRCTRSKMAKTKPKVNAELDGSGDDENKEKGISLCFQERKLNPKQRMKVKDMKALFTPDFRKKQGKENLLSSFYKSSEKKPLGRYTPLLIKNAFVTPSSSKIPLISSAVKSKNILGDSERKKKEEEARRKRQKEEEVLRKKQEMVKAKQEDFRRKNEEKMLKAAAARVAAEKEKSEYLMKMEREREEREKATKEHLERKKEEEAIKKKMAYMTKAMEAEQRRLKEEAARQAKIKEMEIEQRQQEQLRLKQQDESEKILKQRQEEIRIKEAVMKVIQKKKPNVIPLKDKENLDINDLETDEDSDDDNYGKNPSVKKELPEWAVIKEERIRQDRIHTLVPMDLVLQYYSYPSQTPDLTALFGKMTMKRVRSSSAVWLDTPPLKK